MSVEVYRGFELEFYQRFFDVTAEFRMRRGEMFHGFNYREVIGLVFQEYCHPSLIEVDSHLPGIELAAYRPGYLGSLTQDEFIEVIKAGIDKILALDESDWWSLWLRVKASYVSRDDKNMKRLFKEYQEQAKQLEEQAAQIKAYQLRLIELKERH